MEKMNNNGASVGTKPEKDAQEANIPQLRILRQYLKGLAFQNPLGVEMDGFGDKKPDIKVNMEVAHKHLRDADYEVVMKLTARGSAEQKAAFNAELLYGGLIQAENVPEQSLDAVIAIEGPRQLFPFARRILAELVRNGGFPILLLPLVDFTQLYIMRSRRKASTQAETE